MFKQVFATVLLASGLNVFAAEGAGSGGGGAGICYANGKCVTLAQAGLRVSTPEEQESQEFDDKVIAEAAKMEKKLKPFYLNGMLKEMWGKKETFVYVTATDVERFEKFK